MDERFARYVRELFAVEDAGLAAARAGHATGNLPDILISADEGQLLHVLLRAVGARRALELGTLGGYSGVWLARALPPGGTLVTVERDSHHAAVARRAFAKAGVADRVELIEGAALDVLPRLTPPFDAVFLDADKAPLPTYLDWALRLLRTGGLLLCDNAFYDGAVLTPDDRGADAVGVREFNRLAAADTRLSGTIVPVRDGVYVGVKVAD